MSSKKVVLKPTISNICSKAKVSCLLDLNHIYQCNKYLNFINKRYNKKRFVGLIVKLKSTNATILMFKSGSLILMGVKDINSLFLTCDHIKQELLYIGYSNPSISTLKITNICGSMNLNRRIDLERIAACFPISSSYEMEIFPGLKITRNNIKWTVHWNGKIFSTGFKSMNHINKEFKKMQNFLLDFQK